MLTTRDLPDPPRPDEHDETPIEEPDEIKESLDIILGAFQAASANFLPALCAFRAVPKESLLKMYDHFDTIAQPLLASGTVTERNLALHLRMHIPPHIEK